MPAAITMDAAAAKRLISTATRQMPFAASLAINDLAFQVQRAENTGITETFKKPRPFTARSVAVAKATKTALSAGATIYIRPEVAKYLAPYEFGGLHELPGKALLKPVDIRLDQYGQLPQATMARLKDRKDIYIGPITTKAGIISGVWQRVAVTRSGRSRRKRVRGSGVYNATQGALKLLIRFGSAIEVKKRLGFRQRATTLVIHNAAEAFRTALGKALAGAR